MDKRAVAHADTACIEKLVVTSINNNGSILNSHLKSVL